MAVTLLALAEEHIPTVLDACVDWPELAQYGPPYWRPRNSAELRRKIADTAGPLPATAYSFVLVADHGRLVGEASIHAIDWRSRVAQVGICIWRPSDRGKGYGAAGSRAVIDWVVGHLGLRRLEAWILASNGASLGLFRSLGFVEEGRLTQRYLVGSQHMDMLVLARITGA
ncbi:GNAT family N-acetyltransferase [Actinomyces naeslundii]|uniref:GNAT family N-acetyltransferase n=1 Tax=Actinomyces naeslundii TaxID=1655 RepID=UPI00094DDF61|nr:GNAT family N-acetyltransferase [Actinomyces naeslundii]OLO87510.1 GNAT family N-acetyltransferase [Actinomyces naeslundii]OMG14418.1 GNAT family N-acetyltransferase [Actinomyces naeslundii]